MVLSVGGSLNTDAPIFSGSRAPDFIRVCVHARFQGFQTGDGWGGGGASSLSADSAGPGLARQIQTV